MHSWLRDHGQTLKASDPEEKLQTSRLKKAKEYAKARSARLALISGFRSEKLFGILGTACNNYTSHLLLILHVVDYERECGSSTGVNLIFSIQCGSHVWTD